MGTILRGVKRSDGWFCAWSTIFIDRRDSTSTIIFVEDVSTSSFSSIHSHVVCRQLMVHVPVYISRSDTLAARTSFRWISCAIQSRCRRRCLTLRRWYFSFRSSNYSRSHLFCTTITHPPTGAYDPSCYDILGMYI